MKGRRIIFSGPNKLAFEDFEVNEKGLGGDDILVKTHYTLVSSGTDLARFTNMENDMKYPMEAGYCGMGEVLAVGSNVNDFKKGDLLFSYTHISHKSLAVLNKNELNLAVPKGMDEREALFTKIASIGITALRISDLEFGDTVAVIGLGIVGNMAAQLLNLAGMKVIGVDISDKRLATAEKCGIKYLINSSKTKNLKDEIVKLSGGDGVDAAVEATGNPRLFETCCQITRREGEVILLGTPRGEYNTNVTKLLNYVHLDWPGSITVKGALEWRYPLKKAIFIRHSIERNCLLIMDLIKSGRLNVKELMSHVIKPEQLEEAYNGLLNKKEEYTSVVIDWTCS